MNPVLVTATLHRLLTRPVALVTMAAYTLYAVFAPAGLMSGDARSALSLGYGCLPLTWALGAGLIGLDVSSGSLALLLSRPVSRSEYLLSRWAGLVLAVLTVHFGLFFVSTVIHFLNEPVPFSGPLLANFLLASLLVTFCNASLLALLSSWLPGFGDAAAYLGSYVFAGFVMLTTANQHAKASEAIGAFVSWVLLPGMKALENAQNGHFQEGWILGGLYLLVCAVQVGLAILFLERRDLPYVNR